MGIPLPFLHRLSHPSRAVSRHFQWAVLAIACTVTSPASEIIHLRNGFTIEAQSHRQSGDSLDVVIGDGTTSVPLAEVAQIESISQPTLSQPASPQSALAQVTAVPPLLTTLRRPELSHPQDLLRAAALAQGIPPEFVISVAKAESGLHPQAISAKGAIGLMQLMPATASGLAVDALDPSGNALGGAKYLRQLLIQFNGDAVLALAAYNAGPGAVARYKGVPPYAETQRYITRVLNEYTRKHQTPVKGSPTNAKSVTPSSSSQIAATTR